MKSNEEEINLNKQLMTAEGVYDKISSRIDDLKKKKGRIKNRLNILEWEDRTNKFQKILVNRSQSRNILEFKHHREAKSSQVQRMIAEDNSLQPHAMVSDDLNELFRNTSFALNDFYKLKFPVTQ